MSGRLDPDAVPEQASIKTNRSRRSIAATLRRQTSRLFRRKAPNDADLKERRSWRHSTRGRSYQPNLPVAEAVQSPQASQTELEHLVDMINRTSLSETSSSRLPCSPPITSPLRRRLSKARTFIRHPFHERKLRKANAELEALSESPSFVIFEDSDKENVTALAIPSTCPSNSRSSFRLGVEQGVQGR
jgi:hypothetical protein